MTIAKRGLGRGLGALIGATTPAATEGVTLAPVDAIGPNPRQPRQATRQYVDENTKHPRG